MDNIESLKQLDGRSTQVLLSKLDVEQLALALKGTSDELKEHFASNMSDRGLLEVDTEGRLAAADEASVAAAQASILKIAAEL